MHFEYELHIISNSKDNPNSLDKISLILPNQYHDCLINADANKKVYAVRFSFEKSQKANKTNALYDKLMAALEKANQPILTIYAPDIATELEKIQNTLLSNEIMAVALSEAYFKLFITKIIMLLLKTDVEEQHRDKIPLTINDTDLLRKENILSYMDEFYSDSTANIKTLAEKLNLSPRQTSRLVIHCYGMPFKQALTQIRLKQAEKLLLTTNKSVEAIAEQIGYHSTTAFYLNFKKKYGIGPREFRNQNVKH